LETNIAKDHGWLVGENPETRANYFKFVLLKEPAYLKTLYVEYESLIILLDKHIRNFINYIYEIVVATNKEMEQLIAKFNNSLGDILDIQASFGDSHSGGKSVAIITFASGQKLVIKPRNMSLEENFNNFINKLNNITGKEILNLHYAKVHTSAEFGWMEFIEYKDCKDKKQVEDFYKRIGQYLCILYSLNAKDFHHENLIAYGEHPVLIDLEALLHIGNQNHDENSVHDLTAKEIEDSVYSIYLLPTRTLFNEKDGEVNTLDIGGVGANKRQLSPFRSVKITDINSDKVKVEKGYSYVDIESNNPQLNSEIVDSDDYIDQIQHGFSHMYNWILKNKKAFLSMVEGYFSKVKTRVIVKPTFVYSELLLLSYHPDLLRESIHREVYFNRIGMAEFYENPGEIAGNEYYDLLQGDIPYFSIDSNHKFLRNSYNEKVEGFQLDHSPLNVVLNKINDMSLEDFYFQKNIIDYTFMHTANDGGTRETGVKFNSKMRKDEKDTQKYLNIAKDIGDEIIENSISNPSNSERTWVGLMVVGKEEVFTRLSSVEYDLYKGNSGIALYLAYLGKATNDDKYKEAAKQTIKSCVDLIRSLDIHPDIQMDLGAFSGISGILYSIFHIGHILDVDEYRELAHSHSHYLVRNIESNNKFEVISGAAGALLVLLSMYENTENRSERESLMEKATLVTNHIIKKAVHYKNFVLWGSIEQNEGYTGYAHGTSGIASALARYNKYKRDPEIESVIKGALEYESSLFSSENGNWKTNLNRKSRAVAWCHGASGILLSRSILLKYGYQFEEHVIRDMNHALQTTIEKGFGLSYILCHGDSGNLSTLYQIADVTNNQDLRNKCDDFVENLYENFVKTKWKNNAFRSVNIYGLMIGLSGLGYFLLKYGYEENMQDILWLE
ncbi:type 2 lanthipeptide synthetase LanM family protein, partial [Rossellomorea marisflavi]|uniref:type 2 lanthipeptide synthetase LanM family protein n=1 Tax=Rossellomorea marisflavi TaxID=189381 RepID=UPI00295ECEF3